MVNFLLSKKATSTPLWKAKGHEDQGDWVEVLESEQGPGSVERGRLLFAQNCARCHSSQDGPVENRDFHKISVETGLRDDWLGNDQSTPASEVGTYHCRALHSNHMRGQVWEEFSSETYGSREPDVNLADTTGGGRGYFRNLSLVDLWAHAPFLHNNAIGPELCGNPSDPADNFYRSPYVDKAGKRLTDPPACWPYDPSVEGRYKLFLASLDALLNPDRRIDKVTLLDRPIRRSIGPKLLEGDKERRLVGLEIEVPADTPVGLYGSFQHKELLGDLILTVVDPDKLEQRMEQRVGAADAKAAKAQIEAMAEAIAADPGQAIAIAGDKLALLSRLYSTCTARVENAGHRFGEDLSAADKGALTAFLSTL